MKYLFLTGVLWVCSYRVSVAQGEEHLLKVLSTSLSCDLEHIDDSSNDELTAISGNEFIHLNKHLKITKRKSLGNIRKLIAFDYNSIFDKVVVLDDDSKEILLTEYKLDADKELSKLSLGNKKVLNVAYTHDGNVILLSTSENLIQVHALNKGQLELLKEITPRLVQVNEYLNTHLLTLTNGKIFLTVNEDSWLLDSKGNVLWKFNSGNNKVDWKVVKSLTSNRIILVGSGSTAVFNPNNIDARIMCIDTELGKQLWLKNIGGYTSEDVALDCLEKQDGDLCILIKTNHETKIGTINKVQEFSYESTLPNSFLNYPIDYYTELVNINNTIFAIGKVIKTDRTEAVFLEVILNKKESTNK